MRASLTRIRPTPFDFSFPSAEKPFTDRMIITCNFVDDVNLIEVHASMRKRLAGLHAEWKEYVSSNQSLLEDYLGVCTPAFIGILSPDNPANIPLRKVIIEKYLSNITHLVEVKIINRNTELIPCFECGISVRDLRILHEGTCSCECGKIFPCIIERSERGGEDSSDVGSVGRTLNTDSIEKRLTSFQGRQRAKIDKSIIEKIDAYLVKVQGMKPAEEIKKLPCDEYGKKKGTSVAILRDCMKQCGLSEHNKNLDMIGHLLWGWRLPDLSEYMEKLSLNIMKSKEELARIGGQKSLNNDVMLYWHLNAVGVKVRREDFVLPSTDRTRAWHNEMIAQISSNIGIPPITV